MTMSCENFESLNVRFSICKQSIIMGDFSLDFGLSNTGDTSDVYGDGVGFMFYYKHSELNVRRK